MTPQLTIDDLDAVTLAMSVEQAGNPLNLFDDMLAHREVEATNRDPRVLVIYLAPSEWPRYMAEKLVAEHTDDARTLRILASSPFSEVRIEVAANTATPTTTLLTLCRSEHSLIAGTAAANPNLGVAYLEECARMTQCDGVRLGVLEHPGVPRHLVELLATDPCSLIRGTAAAHPLMTNGTLDKSES